MSELIREQASKIAELEQELERELEREEELERELGEWIAYHAKIYNQLTESQAREQQLRKALMSAKYATRPSITLDIIESALNQPSDGIAMREMTLEHNKC